jgi:AraC family transcriptional regulator of adaptative response/methylated-DNA-[protein]-cysteine methyltransferase
MTTAGLSQQALDYARVERAITYLEDRAATTTVSLAEVAAHVHVSPHHFQRLFKRWVGISPTQFWQYLTLDYARAQLVAGQSVLDAAMASGLSGAGRLHDLFVTFTAMSPGEYKAAGAGVDVRYGFHPTPFGECLLGQTARGICHLSFVCTGRDALLQRLEGDWPRARVIEDTAETAAAVAAIFAQPRSPAARPFHLLVRGTNFQIQVWQALLGVPEGALVSYGGLAGSLGKPTASRAVAGAVAANPIAYLIPCHRVITAGGATHGYRWGPSRKRALIGWEAARAGQGGEGG